VYQPKGFYQTTENHSRSSSDTGRSGSPASSENSSESHSKKN
jgi:hypothetical protein